MRTLDGEERTYPSGTKARDIAEDLADPKVRGYRQPKFIFVDSSGGVGYEGDSAIPPGIYTVVKIEKRPRLPSPIRRGEG